MPKPKIDQLTRELARLAYIGTPWRRDKPRAAALKGWKNRRLRAKELGVEPLFFTPMVPGDPRSPKKRKKIGAKRKPYKFSKNWFKATFGEKSPCFNL